jgi:hypothetical protein
MLTRSYEAHEGKHCMNLAFSPEIKAILRAFVSSCENALSSYIIPCVLFSAALRENAFYLEH